MTDPFATYSLWAGLIGGLALFLFGMEVMTQALKSAAGDYLKDVLVGLTRNRFIAAGAGALVTAVVQSSSVTTVILVGFISAGLMSMSQSLAVIMGANIGSTVTAQVLAFKVTELALPIIALGFAVAFFARRDVWRQAGMTVLGLGLIFFGMSVMSDALAPLRTYGPFIDFMLRLHNLLLAVAIGAAFTAIIQSSAATIGILLVLASQGLIALEPAIAITMGANIGTCVTAGFACIGKSREAIRAAVFHVLFNIVGVLLWIAFIPQLAELALWVSPAFENLSGADRLAAETPRQIANVHTIFNVVNTLLFVGFTTQIARLIEWLVPDRPLSKERALQPRYLDDSLLTTPAIALQTARLEIGRLGERVGRMVSAVMPATISGTRSDLERVAAMDPAVDALHFAIIEFLGKISVMRLNPGQSAELMQLAEITNDLENIGDRIATGMVTSARKRIEEQVSVSAETAAILAAYHAEVVDALDAAMQAVTRQDVELARSVSKRKKRFAELSRHIVQHGFDRLVANEPNRLRTYAREMEVMEILEGVFSAARHIARSQMKLRGEQ